MNSNIETELRSLLLSNPGIMNPEDYFNTAVLIPLLKNGKSYDVLFEKRAKKIRQGGEVSFPGGEIDASADKSPEEAAFRETEEELGIPKDKIRLLGKMNILVLPQRTIINPVAGVIEDIDVNLLRIDQNEVEEAFTVPLDFFLNTSPVKYSVKLEITPYETDTKGVKKMLLPVEALGLPPAYAGPWGRTLYDVLIYERPDYKIWGITAKIIFEFAKLLNPELKVKVD